MKCKNKGKAFMLANKVECQVDLTDGQMTASFFDIVSGLMLPVNVSHVYKKNSDAENLEYGCGKDFRLNLHQKIKNIGSESVPEYEFVDETGQKHKFNDTFYYIAANGEKKNILRNDVTVELSGDLVCYINGIKYNVKKEQHTCSGLKLTDKLAGVKGIELLEQRHEEQIRLEEAVETYVNQLKEYVRVNKNTGEVVYRMSCGHDDLHESAARYNNTIALGEQEVIFTESEAIQYKSLLLERTSADKITSLDVMVVDDAGYDANEEYSVFSSEKKFKKGQYGKQLINLKRLVHDLKEDYAALLKKGNYHINGANGMNYQYDEYIKYVKSFPHVMGTTDGSAYCKLNVDVHSDTAEDRHNIWVYNVALKEAGGAQLYCDLRAEMDLLRDNLEEFTRCKQKAQYSTNGFRVTSENLKAVEKRIRAFDNDFSNRADKLRTNIDKFEESINGFIEKQQRELVERQITQLLARTAQNLSDFKKYYKEYRNKYTERSQLLLQLPDKYLSDESGMTRCFNKEGRLVAIYDSYENYAAIEWKYFNGYRIAGIQCEDEKRLDFNYNVNDLLQGIISDNGKTVNFSYDASGRLSKVEYSSEETLEFEYIVANSTVSRIDIISSSDKLKGVIEMANGAVANIKNISLASKIAVAGAEGEGGLINEAALRYNYINGEVKYFHSTVEQDGKLSQFFFDASNDRNLLASFVSENEKGYDIVLTKFEDYKFDFSAKRKSLRQNAVAVMHETVKKLMQESVQKLCGEVFAFNEEAGDNEQWEWEYAELDEFNNPSVAQTSCNKIADNSFVKNTVFYKYNDDHKPTQKRSAILRKNTSEIMCMLCEETIKVNDCEIYTEKYFYNTKGSLVEAWSYAEDEQYTSGVNITETIYDKKGNAVKTFSYNSLDASSKFYSEKEYAENGQVTADIDETGEGKTKYAYDDVTGSVKTAVNPDGSKFSYGRDTNTDEVTSITQSTQSGEENSTNSVYTHGCLTELSSGLNKVNYEYDFKRRKTAVKLNGEAYADYKYEEDIAYAPAGKKADKATVTLAKGTAVECVMETVSDKDGNLLAVKVNNVPQVENTYDNNNLLTVSTDILSGSVTTSSYGALDSITAVNKTGGSVNGAAVAAVDESFSYNEYGELGGKTAVSGATAHSYDFVYKNNYARDLDYVTLPNNLRSKTENDVNGRVKAVLFTDADGGKKLGTYYSYRKHGDHATNTVSAIRYGEVNNGAYTIKDGLAYAYDSVGNITHVYQSGKLSVKYGYDKLSRLIREDNKELGKTNLFTYDNNGNILAKREADYCVNTATDEIAAFTDEQLYCYDGKHPDRLVSFGNEGSFNYDDIGNPTAYKANALTWEKGRQLKQYGITAFFYDGYGKRIKKGNISYSYTSDGKLFKQSDGTNTLEFVYDQSGVCGFKHNGMDYVYRKNLQGDITHIYGLDGTLRGCYTYDAWGNHKVLNPDDTENTGVGFLGNINPFRYRSYYFDTDTQLYYLNSRYYDAETGRFINADDVSYLDAESINGLNLYAYCGNNPVMGYDPLGTINWGKIFKTIAVVFVAVVVVVAVAAITVASGGTLAPVLIGAAIGAGTGLGTSVVTQLVSNGWDFGRIDWSEAFVSMSIGMVTGAFGGSGFSRVGMGIANALTNAGGSIASDIIAGNSINIGSAILAGAVGAFMGSRKPGAQYGKMAGRKAIQTTLSNLSSRSGRGIAGLQAIHGNRLNAATAALNKIAIPTVVKMELKKIAGHLVRNIIKALK